MHFGRFRAGKKNRGKGGFRLIRGRGSRIRRPFWAVGPRSRDMALFWAKFLEICEHGRNGPRIRDRRPRISRNPHQNRFSEAKNFSPFLGPKIREGYSSWILGVFEGVKKIEIRVVFD